MVTQDIQLASLSLAGRKHRDKGAPCEDASLSMSKDGVSIVCLSDGAGGSQYTHADIGSKSVVQTVCDLMVRHFDAFFYDIHESLIRSVLVAAVQSELAIKARELSFAGIESMSATLLFCAVKDSRMICGHIGDGVIARVTGSGLQPVTLPQNGEDASSTVFITLPDAQHYLRLIRCTTDDTHAIVMMTDGVSDMVYDGNKMLIMPVVARLAELANLPKEESDKQLAKTIRSFIIDASPLSDDASIGITYFTDTPKPDPDSLPDSKRNSDRNIKDEMRLVQMEILPRVRLAQNIFTSDFADLNEKSEEEADIDPKPDSSDDIMAVQTDNFKKPKSSYKSFKPVRKYVLFALAVLLYTFFIGFAVFYFLK